MGACQVLNCLSIRSSVVVLSWLFLACPHATQAEETIRLATYNIRYENAGDGEDRWDKRVDAVVKYLRGLDLFGLQEVTYSQLEDLKARLPEFQMYGVGRDDGVNAGEHAVVFYRKDLIKLISKGTFWLSENPEQVGVAGWDAALPRTCTWLKLELLASGKKFLVANTHFDHRGEMARYNSSLLLHDQLIRLAEDLPFLLMGDFNFSPDTSSYAAITKSKILSDAREISQRSPAGPDSTWNGFREIAKDRRIDHIFVRGEIGILNYSVDDPKTDSGRFASDHQPVRVLVGFTGSVDQ